MDIHRVGGREEVNLVVNWARWGKGGRGLEEGDKYGEEGLNDGKKVFGMVDRVKGQVCSNGSSLQYKSRSVTI